MARGAARQRILVKSVAADGIEVEVPRHDPGVVHRADSQAGIPIQMVTARWGCTSQAARAHRPPSNQLSEFVRAEYLCGKVDKQSLGPVGELLDGCRHGTVGELLQIPPAGNDQTPRPSEMSGVGPI